MTAQELYQRYQGERVSRGLAGTDWSCLSAAQQEVWAAMAASTRTAYKIEGYYLDRGTKQRSWQLWMTAESKEQAERTYNNGLPLRSNDPTGFSELRVIEIEENIKVLHATRE